MNTTDTQIREEVVSTLTAREISECYRRLLKTHGKEFPHITDLYVSVLVDERRPAFISGFRKTIANHLGDIFSARGESFSEAFEEFQKVVGSAKSRSDELRAAADELIAKADAIEAGRGEA